METPSNAFGMNTTSLAKRFRAVRDQTMSLVAPLSPEDMMLQCMPDASPPKWHLAHTTWFFETFILERFVGGYTAFDETYRMLFNSYYESVGPKHARPQRGFLSRPTLEEILRYRAHVEERIDKLLHSSEVSTVQDIVELGIQHEQQHQELIVMDAKYNLSCNPLFPAYLPKDRHDARATTSGRPLDWIAHEGGLVTIGAASDGFAFDNERPRHRVFLEPFAIADRLVTIGEYRDFIRDGGYERPELWLSDGWSVVNREDWHAPLYWVESDGDWKIFTLTGLEPLDAACPVSHVSYFEADAFARWRGARLPTEAEWEAAAMAEPSQGSFLEAGPSEPSPIAAHADHQFFGELWQWTSSAYAPYPGFKPLEGSLGEYNGKFMCNQYVLRGGCRSTPASHFRTSYRNFFPAHSRWQFSGIRLARGV